MKNYNTKIDKFFKWMKESGGEGNDPLYKIPTLRLFQQYQLESDEPVEDLTEQERIYLQTAQENLVFQLSIKGVLKGDIAKLNLANDFGWSERTKAQEDGPIDYVTFDSTGLLTENTINHEGESLENDAIKDMEAQNNDKQQEQK